MSGHRARGSESASENGYASDHVGARGCSSDDDRARRCVLLCVCARACDQ